MASGRMESALIMAVRENKSVKTKELNLIIVLPVADNQKVFQQLGIRNPMDGINKGEIGPFWGLLAGIGNTGEGPKTKFPVLASKKGDFVLLADPKHRDALERVLKSRKGVSAAVQPAREWLESQEIFGAVTEQGIEFGLGMYLGFFGVNTPQQEEQIKLTFKDIQKNVKLIAFGAHVDQDVGTRLRTRIYLDRKSEYAKTLSKIEAIDGKLLNLLPTRDYLIAALIHISRQINVEGVLLTVAQRSLNFQSSNPA